MKKSILTLAFSIAFAHASLAVESKNAAPLSSIVNENMRVMVSTYIENLGKLLQLRGTDLHTIGEGLLSHTNLQESQTVGKEATDFANQMHLLGTEMRKGKVVDAKETKDFVNTWL